MENAGASVGLGRGIAFKGIFPKALLLPSRVCVEVGASVGDRIGGDGKEDNMGNSVEIFGLWEGFRLTALCCVTRGAFLAFQAAAAADSARLSTCDGNRCAGSLTGRWSILISSVCTDASFPGQEMFTCAPAFLVFGGRAYGLGDEGREVAKLIVI